MLQMTKEKETLWCGSLFLYFADAFLYFFAAEAIPLQGHAEMLGAS